MTATEPNPLYVGAQTCDFAPAWRDTCPELLAMLKACFAADPDELTPLLVLADMLAERADPRERWLRAGVTMWEACGALKSGERAWDYDSCKAALAPVCQTAEGWRVSGLWGCLVAWHSPAGDGTSRVMGHTWVDARVFAVQRSLWFWALGFLETNPVDDAAWSQANAAWSQADAAGRQAYAAGRQAYAAGSQAYAAGSQASAAWRQAYAAGSQADAAGRQAAIWRFARSCWEEVCAPHLKTLNSATITGSTRPTPTATTSKPRVKLWLRGS